MLLMIGNVQLNVNQFYVVERKDFSETLTRRKKRKGQLTMSRYLIRDKIKKESARELQVEEHASRPSLCRGH